MMSNAELSFVAEGLISVPKLEWDTRATFGFKPKRLIVSDAINVISAISCAEGSLFT